MSEPTQHNNASVIETAEDNLVPPGMQAHQGRDEHSSVQVAELAVFLGEHFPEEMTRTNRQRPERIVDTAMRLLLALSTSAPPTQVSRCPEPYCNQNAGHATECGWVHAG